MKKTVDVLVIGLGPGGGAAVKEIAKAGYSVIGLDKNKIVGFPVQCAEFIPLPMGAYAQAEGILKQSIQLMKTFLPSGQCESSAFPGLMIDRAIFDQSLVKQAQEYQAEILTATLFKQLQLQENKAIVIQEDQTIIIEYKVLIAADGPHSPVAKRLELPDLEVVYTRQYTVPLYHEYYDTDIWLSDEYPGGYAWFFPKKELANIGLGADRDFTQDLKTPLDHLHQYLIEQGLVGENIVSRTGGAIPVGGLRDVLYYNNIVFVGDAAGLTHPITGAGIAAAVISGEAAARAAIEYLQGDKTAFDHYEEDIRDQYQDSLERAVKRRQQLKHIWHTNKAQQDSYMRQGWIAFPEYFTTI